MIPFLRARATLVLLLLGLIAAAACSGGTEPDDDGDGGDGGGGDGGDAVALVSGQALGSRAGAEDSETLYRVGVPEGTARLLITTRGGTGDVDLYARAGQAPTLESFDCHSEIDAGGGNDETCDLAAPVAGTWYVLLHGVEAYRGVTLTATASAATPPGGGGGGGGGAFPGYTLAVTPADSVLVLGGSMTLAVALTRGDYGGAVALGVQNLPAGVTAGAATVAAGATTAAITLTASPTAALGTTTISVTGSAPGLADRAAPVLLQVLAGVGGAVRWHAVSTGTDHSCGVTLANAGYCWGMRYAGQIGDGSPPSAGAYGVPQLVAGGHQWAEIVAGGALSCGRTTAGSVLCWGSNAAGKAGTNSAEAAFPAPTPVAFAGGARQVTVGNSHACLLSEAGDVWCWGDNTDLKVAGVPGLSPYVGMPVQAAPGRAYTQVVASGTHTCALAADGAVWCWGSNAAGRLGMGTDAPQSAPQRVLGGPWAQIGAGQFHTCALTPAGAAWCWGGNPHGQVGIEPAKLNVVEAQATPVQVGGGHVFRQITGGGSTTCGLTTGSESYCWGGNSNGSFGDGSAPAGEAHSPTPTPTAGGYSFERLSAGTGSNGSFCGTTPSGEAWCWGSNSGLKLGSSDAGSRAPSPVRVDDPG